MRLDGSVAAVTGGGSGIGRAICMRLAAEGARVAALDIDLAGAQETVDAAGGGLALVADVSASSAVDAAIAEVERSLGPLDILVNNAGAVGGAHLRRVTPLLETQRAEQAAGGVKTPLEALVRITDDEWRQLLAVHLDGTFHGTRAAARAMAPRGNGAIVNMASVCGIEGCTWHPHYSAAKAGIIGSRARSPRSSSSRASGSTRSRRATSTRAGCAASSTPAGARSPRARPPGGSPRPKRSPRRSPSLSPTTPPTSSGRR
jgi:NAD(P)-dependent dehydrogenase (short-subunit alcohol dehydrogenase family)